jgi:hypothetical protein
LQDVLHQKIMTERASGVRAAVCGLSPGRVMYNVNLVRNLCKTITREKDAQKSAELLALLRAVMGEDHEEIRVRMAFLAENYSLIGGESQAA